MPHFAFERIGNILVIVQDTSMPSDEQWSEYLRVCAQMDQELGPHGASAGALVFTDGGVPGSKQRGQLVALLKGRPASTSIVTDNTIVRLALGALNVLNPALKVFPAKEWKMAARFAGAKEAQEFELLKTAVRLSRLVGELKVLKTIGL